MSDARKTKKCPGLCGYTDQGGEAKPRGQKQHNTVSREAQGGDFLAETVIRFKRTRGFTILQNGMLRDPRLSLKTKGLFAVMLSKPGSWEFSIAALSREVGAGKDAIRTSLQELIGAGYLERDKQSHDDGGKFGGSVYVLHEESASPWSGFPTTVEPSTVEPSTADPTQVNSENSNIPPKAPQWGRRARPESRTAPEWKPERFAGFWSFYPRGEKKQAAILAWDRLRPDDALIDEIARALRRQKASEDWQRGIAIPYASTYLNQQRWTDTGMRAMDAEPPREEVLQEWT